MVRPLAKSLFGIHDPKGLSYPTQLKVGLSKLNFHKFKHNFRDTINPMCPASDGIEDTEHLLLLCPSFLHFNFEIFSLELLDYYYYDHLCKSPICFDALMHLLLYGDQYPSCVLNRNILELTLRFIHENWSV